MFEIIFGAIWMGFLLPFYYVFFTNPNGVEIPAILIIGLFSIVGIAMLIMGIRKVARKNRVKKEGYDCYGKISMIRPNGTYLSGRPQLDAEVVCCVRGVPKIFTATIGFKYGDYYPGACVKIRCLDDDAILLELANENRISTNDLETIDQIIQQKQSQSTTRTRYDW